MNKETNYGVDGLCREIATLVRTSLVNNEGCYKVSTGHQGDLFLEFSAKELFLRVNIDHELIDAIKIGSYKVDALLIKDRYDFKKLAKIIYNLCVENESRIMLNLLNDITKNK